MDLNVSLVSSYSYEGMYLGDVFRETYPYGYVSDRLSSVFKDWTCNVPVGIFSGTGTGKNTFVEKDLIPEAMRCGMRVLLFSNRVALNRQTKKRLARIFDLEYLVDKYTDQGLDDLTDFGGLTVVSYQQLEAWINEKSYKLAELQNKSFAYVICDEVHYFTSDCGFNAFTDVSLDYIVQHFRKAVRIYMTATPEEVFPILRERENGMGPVYRSGYPFREFEWQIYEFERDFSHVNAYAFDTIDDLAEIIERSDDKWAVFVDKKEIGKQLIDKIGKGTLITAESKKAEDSSYSTFKKIVDEEKYDEQVIVSTAVLENGINIKDRYVKKVAIFCNDKIRFLQMLGRIRRIENCGLDVYIVNTTREEVLKSYNCLLRNMTAIRNYYADVTDFYNQYIRNPEPRTNVRGSFTVKRDGTAHINSIFPLKTQHFDTVFWEELKKRYEAGEEYPVLKAKFQWLGKKFEEERQVGKKQIQEVKERLIMLMEEYMKRQIYKTEQPVFCEKFSELHRAVYGRRKEDKQVNQVYGLNVIKKLLDSCDLPYTINNKNRDFWQIQKGGSTYEDGSSFVGKI